MKNYLKHFKLVDKYGLTWLALDFIALALIVFSLIMAFGGAFTH